MLLFFVLIVLATGVAIGMVFHRACAILETTMARSRKTRGFIRSCAALPVLATHMWLGSDPFDPYITCCNVALVAFLMLTLRDEGSGSIVM